MAVKLATLLQRARALKQSTSIDPPLQVSELITDNEPLLGHGMCDKEAGMLAVDRAAKNIFYGNLVSQIRCENMLVWLTTKGFNFDY